MTPMTWTFQRGRRTGRDAAYEDLPRHRNQAAALGNSWRAAPCFFHVLLVVMLALVVMVVVVVVVAVGGSLMFWVQCVRDTCCCSWHKQDMLRWDFSIHILRIGPRWFENVLNMFLHLEILGNMIFQPFWRNNTVDGQNPAPIDK